MLKIVCFMTSGFTSSKVKCYFGSVNFNIQKSQKVVFDVLLLEHGK